MGLTTVLLDLDGTLTDPAPGIIAGCHQALRSLGRTPPPDDDLLWMIGPPVRHSFARLLGGPDHVEAAVSAYRAYIGAGGFAEARVYDGIPETLAALQDRYDGALFLCTAKSHPFAVATLDHFGLARYFRGVYGAEPGGRFEDKGDLMEHLLATEGLDASDACMIGDRGHDIVAARRHAMASIGVTWGYGSHEELSGAGADRLCHAVADLPDAIEGL